MKKWKQKKTSWRKREPKDALAYGSSRAFHAGRSSTLRKSAKLFKLNGSAPRPGARERKRHAANRVKPSDRSPS